MCEYFPGFGCDDGDWTNLSLMYSIESMKMETVIRSPQKGVIKRLAHKEGVSCSEQYV